jgi:hypothetical protein
MNVLRWMTACAVTFLWAATPSYSQILSPSDRSGVELVVQLGWTDAVHKDGNFIWADLILFPDHLVISKHGLTPEGDDISRGCANAMPRGPDGKILVSPETIAQLMNCDSRSTGAHVTATRHAVMLPIAAGPSKCTEAKLTNLSYRICAALLQQSPNALRLEYEEDNNYSGDFTASRTRFDIMLLRDPAGSGRIEGCNVKTVAAFTFNPNQPTKLVALDRIKGERCDVHGR